MVRRATAALLVAAMTALAATAAAAADDDAADPFAPPPELAEAEALRAPFRAARALHDAGKLAEAAEAFRLLHERLPLVGLLYDHAVCLEKLGDHAAADELYRRAFGAASAPEDRAAILARLDRRGPPQLRGVVFVVSRPRMRLRLAGGTTLGKTPWNGMLDGPRALVFAATGLPDAEKQVTLTPGELTTLYYFAIDPPAHGHLTVATHPPRAHVFIDGEPRGGTPFSANVALGRHHVVVMKDGFVDVARDVEVTRDAPDHDLDLTLAPKAPARPRVVLDPRAPGRTSAPWKLVCGGLLAAGTVNVGRFVGEDGAPATVATAVLGTAAVGFLAWGVVSLLD